MPIIVTKLAALLMAAFGFITITTTSIIIMTEEGDEVELSYEHLIDNVKEEIRERIQNDPNEYLSPHGEFTNQSEVEDAAINAVIERSIAEDIDLTDKQREDIYEKLTEKLGDEAESIASEVLEEIKEVEIMRRNPFKYHGLKWSDFN